MSNSAVLSFTLMLIVAFLFHEDESASNSGQISKIKTKPLAFPDIFIIGAQKCGTTSTAFLLLQHGDICNKGLKEKHYFSDLKAFTTDYTNHWSTYNSNFQNCSSPSQLTMDATPSYVWLDYVPELVQRSYTKKELAKKKFLLLLREPVQRQYSEYQRVLRLCLRAYDAASTGYDFEHINKKRTGEQMSAHAQKYCELLIHHVPGEDDEWGDRSLLTFSGWIDSDAGASELSRGYYLEQIKRWLQVIDRSQLLILHFQDIVSDTTDMMRRVASFLDIDPQPWYNSSTHKIDLPEPSSTNRYITWPPAAFDCTSAAYLWKLTSKKNEGLAAFINGHKERPSQEPLFPLWSWTEIANKCQDLTSSSSSSSTSSSASAASASASLPPKWVFYNRSHE